MQKVVDVLETRQFWVACGGLAVAIAQAAGVGIPAHLEAIVEAVFAAVFVDATVHKAAVAASSSSGEQKTAGGAR